MDSIIDTLSTLGDFLTGIITAIAEFFSMVGNSISDVVELLPYMPSYILYACAPVLVVLLVKLLIPGGGSG